jgi:hypothetical protein
MGLTAIFGSPGHHNGGTRMKKHMIITLVVAAMLLLPLGSALATDVFISKTETLQWNPDKAYEGYNLFVNDGKNWLVDMEGRVVNSWDYVDTPHGMYAHLLENGNIRVHSSPSYVPRAPLQAGGSQGRIEEYNWEGDRVWFMDMFDGWTETAGVRTRGDGSTATYRFHHDAQRMYNDAIDAWTYIVLIWVAKGEADADNLGVDSDLNGGSRAAADDPETDVDESQLATWSPCGLIEILPDYASGEGGDIIWYWTFADHMVTTDPDGTGAALRADDSDNEYYLDWAGRTSRRPLITDTAGIAANPQLLDVNGMHYTAPDGPRTDYQHCNSIDYDENTGHVAINAKAANEFFVVDHDGTFLADATANDWSSVGAAARGAAGDFLYRWGNRANYGQGQPAGFYDEGDMEMYGTHDIQFINDYHWRAPRAGDTWEDPADYGTQYMLPGAGDFMMYDNGCYNPLNAGSKIIQVDPYVDTAYNRNGDVIATADDSASGFQLAGTSGYVDSADLPRRAQVAWEYGGGRNGIYSFYSSYISGCTRMPNGNTIICSGATSHFFEVTAEKEVVWEYLLPTVSDGVFSTTKGAQGGANMCFRFHRFAADHPALKGRDLTPGATLTGRTPSLVGEYAYEPEVVVPPAPTGWGTSGLATGEGGGGSAGGTGGGVGGGTY